jgi:type II secretion system protein G
MALAIFDLDNTLISGDSDHSWGEFLVSEQLVDAQQFKKANDQFYADYVAGSLDIFAYTINQKFMQALVKPPTTCKKPANWNGPYLERLPKDPWGMLYRYQMPGLHGAVDVFTFGADGVEGGDETDADIGSWQQD